jgi:hypothetical protein
MGCGYHNSAGIGPFWFNVCKSTRGQPLWVGPLKTAQQTPTGTGGIADGH